MRRDVTIGMLLLVVLIGLVSGAVAGTLHAMRSLYDGDVQLAMRDQPMRIVILDPLDVRAHVHTPLTIAVDDTLHARIAVDQIVALPISEQLQVHAHFDHPVRVQLDVRVQDYIEIDQTIALNSEIETELLGSRLRLPIRGRIPIRARVPIDIVVPVDQDMPLRFSAPLRVDLDQTLRVPLRTSFEAQVPISGQLTVPVLDALESTVHVRPEPLRIEVESADLRFPAAGLGFESPPP